MAKVSDCYDYKVMLEEAQSYYQSQIRSFDVLRDHAKTILGLGSVSVSLFATFGEISIYISKSNYYLAIIVSIIFLYGWLMLRSLVAVIPKQINYPIVPKDTEYAEACLNKTEKDIIKQRLSNYLNVIEKNEIIIQERRKLGQLITVQLSVIIIFILISSLIRAYL